MARIESTSPFRQFVLKVHSRCDLACDHCYVYERADQSWRGRPKVIARETVALAAERIAEHGRQHNLPGVRVILHGGEPLLAGTPRLGEIVRSLRRIIERACAMDLRIQTNGVRLDSELCELFLAERVKVGISLDGDRAANDLHRRYRNGRSSYDRVIAAVNLLRQERYRPIYAGLLATIDIRSDPVASYRALAELDPPVLDFLLPHGTWDEPPPGVGPGAAPYADWLIAVHAEWLKDGRRVPVRLFESILLTTLGGASRIESLGLSPSDVVVIETDGQIELADSLKVAYDGAPATGLDIFRNALDEAAAHVGVKARQQGIAGLSATCQRCPLVTSCGSGLYAHRYRTGSGFDNPSVYCADLEKIISHVRANLRPTGSEQPAHASKPPPNERRGHQLPEADFNALAAGYGDAGSIGHLNTAHRSIRRTLLRVLRAQAAAAGRGRADGNVDGSFTAGWELLTRLDRATPDAVDGVLAHPYVRAWAEHCLRSDTPSGRSPRPGAGMALGHLASIAAAAAIKSGALAELDVPVIGGYVHLPTLGRLRVGDAQTAALTVADGGFEVRVNSGKWQVRPPAEEAEPDWQPVRRLSAGDFTVLIEDTDPFRDVHEWPAAARLTGVEAAAWQDQFTTAWSLIERDYPAYAAGIAAGLRVLMPLANDEPGREIAASARQAYGAIGVARPASGGDLALLIIHEFQHVKLGALIDLFDLYNQTDRRRFYAPWREDPRSVGALLQGTYAHLGVTDYWRIRRHQVTGPAAAEAEERFARWRLVTAAAIDELAASGALTSLGMRFVDGMRVTIEPWVAEPVSQRATDAARQWAAALRDSWDARRAGSADGVPGEPD